jgi:hypothetical protein
MRTGGEMRAPSLSRVRFVSLRLRLDVGTLFTTTVAGWRLPATVGSTELPKGRPLVSRLVLMLLRYACPAAIVAVLVVALA